MVFIYKSFENNPKSMKIANSTKLYCISNRGIFVSKRFIDKANRLPLYSEKNNFAGDIHFSSLNCLLANKKLKKKENKEKKEEKETTCLVIFNIPHIVP